MKRCEIRILHKLCVTCRVRQAHFRYERRVKWDRDHNLCFQCFRSVRNRARSESLARHRDSMFYLPALPAALVSSADVELLLAARVSPAQIHFQEVEAVSSI
jgi:hypothetical protein